MGPAAIYAIVGGWVVLAAYPKLGTGGKLACFVVFPLHVAAREAVRLCIKYW